MSLGVYTHLHLLLHTREKDKKKKVEEKKAPHSKLRYLRKNFPFCSCEEFFFGSGKRLKAFRASYFYARHMRTGDATNGNVWCAKSSTGKAVEKL